MLYSGMHLNNQHPFFVLLIHVTLERKTSIFDVFFLISIDYIGYLQTCARSLFKLEYIVYRKCKPIYYTLFNQVNLYKALEMKTYYNAKKRQMNINK